MGDEEDIDPFDLFEMFFNQGGFRDQNGRIYRRQRQRPRQENPQQGRQMQNRRIVLVQLLPLFVLIFFSIVPYLFQSTPYYQFYRNEEFYRKMATSKNKIDYYVGDRFLNKYTGNDIKSLEPQIEQEYLHLLSHECNRVVKYKNELEYKLSYYRHSLQNAYRE